MRPAGDRCFTLEQLHRMLWLQDRGVFLSLVREGCNSARSYQQQFEREEADRAPQPVPRTGGCIR